MEGFVLREVRDASRLAGKEIEGVVSIAHGPCRSAATFRNGAESMCQEGP